jgi:ArsR family transcriptional regulator
MEKEMMKIIKALADENRMRILNLLYYKKLCVCEIEKVLNINQSNASRHLIKLKDADLIDSVKQAQFVCHFVNPAVIQKFPFVQSLLEQVRRMDKYQLDLAASANVTCAVVSQE